MTPFKPFTDTAPDSSADDIYYKGKDNPRPVEVDLACIVLLRREDVTYDRVIKGFRSVHKLISNMHIIADFFTQQSVDCPKPSLRL